MIEFAPPTLEKGNELAEEAEYAVLGDMALRASEASRRGERWLKLNKVSKYAGRTLCAVALTLAATAGTAAMAQETEAPPQQTINECAWNPLNGPDINCDSPQIPVACAPESQLQQLMFQPNKLAQIAKMPELDQTNKETTESPHMSIGIEDPGGVIYGVRGRAEAILYAGRLAGATKYRVLIYPDKFQNRDKHIRDTERLYYDTAINKAEACGYEVDLTVACNNRHWTVEGFGNFIKKVGLRFKNKIKNYAICNEPNLEGIEYWLREMSYHGRRLSLPQTFRVLYQRAEKVLHKIDSKFNVDPGGLNYDSYPLKFFRRFLKPLPEEKGDTRIVLSNVRFHPYRVYNRKNKNKPIVFNPNKKPTSKIITIENHQVVESEVHKAYISKKIKTLSGKEPKVIYDEFNEFENATGKRRKRNIRPNIRAINAVRILNELCGDIDVAGISFYILDALTKLRKVFDSFDPSMIKGNGKISKALYGIAAFKDKSPSCLEK